MMAGTVTLSMVFLKWIACVFVADFLSGLLLAARVQDPVVLTAFFTRKTTRVEPIFLSREHQLLSKMIAVVFFDSIVRHRAAA